MSPQTGHIFAARSCYLGHFRAFRILSGRHGPNVSRAPSGSARPVWSRSDRPESSRGRVTTWPRRFLDEIGLSRAEVDGLAENRWREQFNREILLERISSSTLKLKRFLKSCRSCGWRARDHGRRNCVEWRAKRPPYTFFSPPGVSADRAEIRRPNDTARRNETRII